MSNDDPNALDFGDEAPQPESFETARPVSKEVRRAEGHAPSTDRRGEQNVGAPRAAVAIGGRSLPHSLEAEEYLLSCCLLDGNDVVTRCKDAGIEVSSFYDPKHGIIYDCLLHLFAEKKPIEISVVAEELKHTRQLDSIGGYAFLTQVTSRIPTQAQASYFIEKVREQSILRNLIMRATSAVEAAYNYSGIGDDIDDFLADQSSKVASSSNGYATRQDELEARQFSMKRLAKKPDAILSIHGVTIATGGNLVAFYAASKAGKTAFQSAAISCTMTTPEMQRDTLGFSGPNYEKGAVIHFDTEQSTFDWQQKTMLTALKRAGATEPPDWLMSYHLTGMAHNKALDFVRRALKLAKKKFGRVRLVVIDGIAELVSSPNNEEESIALITELQGWAIEYDCAIVCILHLNPIAKDKLEKGRGHLGSHLERKAETNLVLKKNGDVTAVVAEGVQRNAPIPADKSPHFKWSEEAGMHMTVERPKSEEKANKRGRSGQIEISFSDVRGCFPLKHEQPAKMKELHRRVQQIVPVKSEGHFYTMLCDWVLEGHLEAVDKDGGRGYRMGV